MFAIYPQILVLSFNPELLSTQTQYQTGSYFFIYETWRIIRKVHIIWRELQK